MSQRVAIARTLCIAFMTFVHVQPGIAENVYDREAGFFDIVYFVLTRLIGLSSVSLLGIVSGYFIVSSLVKAGPARVLAAKLRTLVVPLVSWNALMLALLVAYGVLSDNWRDMLQATPLGIANAFLALTEWPLVVPLWFLRDLFVCCLVSPLLLLGLRRSAPAVFVVLVAYTLFGTDWYLMQRPQLLLFFAIGMWLRLADIGEWPLDRVLRPFLAGLAIMVAIFLALRIERVSIGEMNETLRIVLDTLLRVSMAAGCWLLTGVLRRSRFGSLLIRFEPYAFFLFCSHAIVFVFGGILLRRVFGNYGSELYPVSFFIQPVIAVVAAIVGLHLISRFAALTFFLNASKGLPVATPPSSAANRNSLPQQTR
ncbi:acyltransferase [Mesorhizobium sp. YIM 152430]|uniref:acyltransferase family protein n=1 Tax=Mesorhizobium sp. YIM 152430 TaxID=3031761 RepID=UPI0023D992E2|nr:acyltransferase [Mesorhizobium sp. YIM 152430]MDF1600812.1 acyltransferase [Mesorhizobium sp. YIM 152430]